MNAVPPMPRLLGLAGLLPQFACLAAIAFGPPEWRWTALALAWGYAALIFSFLGGMWWGLAAVSPDEGRRAPAWLWFAAVLPSLLALASFVPWVVGASWPEPELIMVGLLVLLSPLVDMRLVAIRPGWWMALRVPLSIGLGLSTVLAGLL